MPGSSPQGQVVRRAPGSAGARAEPRRVGGKNGGGNSREGPARGPPGSPKGTSTADQRDSCINTCLIPFLLVMLQREQGLKHLLGGFKGLPSGGPPRKGWVSCQVSWVRELK